MATRPFFARVSGLNRELRELRRLRWKYMSGDRELKEAVTNMPGVPTYGYIGFVGWDEQYWTNWPGSENPYNAPYTHWPNFKYFTPFLTPTGN